MTRRLALLIALGLAVPVTLHALTVLRQRGDSSVHWASREYPDETHDTDVLKSFYDGLRMIFSGYEYPRDPSTDQLVGSLEDMKAHFAGLGTRLGVAFEPPEDIVNELAHRYLAADSIQLAVAAFRFNVAQHPESARRSGPTPTVWEDIMPRSRLVALAFVVMSCATAQPYGGQPPAERGVEYRGGLWFDGTKFVAKTMYVADGVFHTRAPAHIDSVIELRGGYVVPPFADAHQHFVDPRIDQAIALQLGAGIFYLKDQGSAPIIRRMIAPMLNTPASFDWIGANQAWTSPGGHPVEVIKRGSPATRPFAAFVRDSLDPAIVMQVESPADIDQRWAYFLAGKPDFVKIHLYRSENYERLRNDSIEGNGGMDPRLVPEMVKRARAAGLEVSAHVFTAVDFRAAVQGGVQQIAHLPGGRGPDSAFALTDADGAAAARANVTVVTTVTQHEDSALTARLLATQYARNIDVLRRHQVPLLIGSDLIGRTATIEVAALARSGLFTNLELLRMWSVTTPRAIFPSRRIGMLQDGYEASFLVLRADPLRDIAATREIALRVKQGVPVR